MTTAAAAKNTSDTKPKAPETASPVSSGKPDKAGYDAEQIRLNKEIEALQAPFNAIKDKIGLTTKDGQSNDKRKALRAELDSLREQQAVSKDSRTRIREQTEALRETIKKKRADLTAAKSKHPYKSVAEVDAHVKKLESQIDSGTMKLAEEKRALQEISQAKRARRTIEGFDKDYGSIEEDNARLAELQKQMDDPKAKAASERYEEIQKELDAMKKESDEAFGNRNKLFDERNRIKAQIDALYTQKKDSAQKYKDANNRYYQKLNEDRARRAEKYKQQRDAEELEKRMERAEQIREEAAIPAFVDDIETCQMLIDWLLKSTGGIAGEITTEVSTAPDAQSIGAVPQLELRKVEVDNSGLVVRKKKGEEEDNYFVGGKGKKKGGKTSTPAAPVTISPESPFQMPYGKLTALLNLSIPAPASYGDVERVVSDLKTKKAWYEANQARVTAEKVAKAEKDIAKLTLSSTTNGKVPSEEETTSNGAVGSSDAFKDDQVSATEANGDSTAVIPSDLPAASAE